ncbi:MAG: putative aminohydrolase SsnA [Phycisphaerales bacterium]|nr:putative aminohydrolase SsnA [Phycisphaerales bacterium]
MTQIDVAPKWIVGGTVVTLGDDCRVIPNGAVRVDGDAIGWVGARSDAGNVSGEVIDAGGGLIMPGFINAHMHFYSTFACGIAIKDAPPTNFLEILQRLWWRLDKALTLDDVRSSALVPLVRSLEAGVTTVIDHHASPNAVRGSLDVIADAARAVGVRTCLCYEVSNRDGSDIAADGVAENAAFIEACRTRDDMVASLFGLHASMTLDDALLARCVDAGRRLDAGFHIHVSESHFDPDDSQAKYAKRVVARLADAGVLGAKSICAHCIHVDDSELALLADTRTNVVHNPQSNLNNAVGRADVPKMLDMGICVGLGTDGMSATLLDDVRLVNLLHKHGTNDPRVGFVEAGKLLLENNARIASRYFGKPVGALAPGHKADVIVVDYDPPTPLAADNILGHVLFGLPSARVTDALVDGKQRLENGKVLGVNKREVTDEARRRAAEVWKRF